MLVTGLDPSNRGCPGPPHYGSRGSHGPLTHGPPVVGPPFRNALDLLQACDRKWENMIDRSDPLWCEPISMPEMRQQAKQELDEYFNAERKRNLRIAIAASSVCLACALYFLLFS